MDTKFRDSSLSLRLLVVMDRAGKINAIIPPTLLPRMLSSWLWKTSGYAVTMTSYL